MRDVHDIFKEAIQIQDAANITAIVGAWNRARIDLAAMNADDTRRYIDVLYMSKLSSLLKVNTDCIGGVEREGKDAFREAYHYAKTLTGEE